LIHRASSRFDRVATGGAHRQHHAAPLLPTPASPRAGNQACRARAYPGVVVLLPGGSSPGRRVGLHKRGISNFGWRIGRPWHLGHLRASRNRHLLRSTGRWRRGRLYFLLGMARDSAEPDGNDSGYDCKSHLGLLRICSTLQATIARDVLRRKVVPALFRLGSSAPFDLVVTRSIVAPAMAPRDLLLPHRFFLW
jgi:hypothetical protein